MTMGFSGHVTPIPETAEVDCGIKRFNSGEDAPKTIESEKLLILTVSSLWLLLF